MKGSAGQAYPFPVEAGPSCKYVALFWPQREFDDLRESFVFQLYHAGAITAQDFSKAGVSAGDSIALRYFWESEAVRFLSLPVEHGPCDDFMPRLWPHLAIVFGTSRKIR